MDRYRNNGDNQSMTTYAEVAQERKELLERKSVRFSTFAEHAQERSEEHWKKSDLSFIPMGQPILMGHHSQRAHENAIERSNNHSRKSIEEDEKARKWSHRADHAETLLTKMEESKPYMSGKIADAEKDIRLWERRIEKSGIFIKIYEDKGRVPDLIASACGFSPDAIESARQDNERAKSELPQAQEKRDYWRAKLDAIGGVFDISTLKKGDVIKTTHGVFPVKSVNKKTVTVSPWMPGVPDSKMSLPACVVLAKVI